MRTLNLEQMENVQGGAGGWQCLGGIASMVLAVGAVATTGPIGGWAVASFAFGWLSGGVNAGIGCGTWLESLSESLSK